MKVGLVRPRASGSRSLDWVFEATERAVGTRHDIIRLPVEYADGSRLHRAKLAELFVRECDAIIGVGEAEVLEARRQAGRHIPYLICLLGHLPRGAAGTVEFLPYATDRDVLVVNSSGDAEIAHNFFANARTRLVPFAFDQTVFRAMSETDRKRLREELGFAERARILLYSGRMTLEKNIHTLFRVFRAVLDLEPDTYLLLVGNPSSRPFPELGLQVRHLQATLARAAEKLAIPSDRLLFPGPVEPARLRDLYNASHLVVNMTLHHDENFGLAQVEAIACGTPVVGTCWGG